MSCCDASRFDLWTRLMMIVALRGSSSVPPKSLPPKMSAERTSGMARNFSEIARVTRSGRQLDREQRAAVVVRGDESGWQQSRRPQRSGENQSAGEQGYPAVAHGSAHEPGVETHDR